MQSMVLIESIAVTVGLETFIYSITAGDEDIQDFVFQDDRI